MKMRVWPGRPYPLGATWDGSGTNFALYSEHATKVELCLFDDPNSEMESHRITLPEQTDSIWHAYLPDILPGQIYGYRVDGPYKPAEGHRFNAHKILLDPYAKSIAREPRWSDELWGYRVGDPQADLSFDDRDNARYAPLAAVLDEAFTWGDDRPPRIPWNKTLIYEMHVKGFTKLHPEVPEKLRGTYAGIGSDAAIRYLKSLGITAVELLPVHEFVDDRHLVDRGLVNYWGYNTLGFLRRPGVMPRWRPPATWCASSRRWSATCTRQGSKSSWTSSTTTPPKAISSARRCHFAASTTRRIIACRRKIRATTWISPAAATRCTCAIRACCN